MTTMTEILVFVAKDDPNSGFERGRTLVANLQKRGQNARLVHKTGNVLADLELVAQHRVTHTPTILVVDDKKVISRRTTLVPPEQVIRTLYPVVEVQEEPKGLK